MGANDEILKGSILQAVLWLRFAKNEGQSISAMLGDIDGELGTLLGVEYADFDYNNVKQRKELIQKLEAMYESIYTEKIAPAVISSLNDAAITAAGLEAHLLTKALNAAEIGMDLTIPNEGVLITKVAETPMKGAILDDWVDKLKENNFNKVWQTIVEGSLDGKTAPQIVNDLIGTKALNYKDGVTQISKKSLQTLVKTTISHATNVGKQALWEDNDDLIKAVRWVSTLDSRTSAVCRFRDGQVGPVTAAQDFEQPEGTLPIVPLMARPPAHPNCRSQAIPITKSWEELGIDLEELPEGTRSSLNGKVPASMTYYEWLNTQSAKMQKEVLGEARFNLWKDEGVKPDRFHDDDGGLLTLEELKKKSIT